MPSASIVARYLTELAARTGSADGLSRPRLDRLLYLAQAWHLAAFDYPLFDDPILATDAGPVVLAADLPADGDPLPFRDRRFVDAMWDHHRGYSADGLTSLIVGQPPWPDASPTALAAVYRKRDELRHFDAAEWEAVTVGEEEIEAGRFVPYEQVMARLRGRCATS